MGQGIWNTWSNRYCGKIDYAGACCPDGARKTKSDVNSDFSHEIARVHVAPTEQGGQSYANVATDMLPRWGKEYGIRGSIGIVGKLITRVHVAPMGQGRLNQMSIQISPMRLRAYMLLLRSKEDNHMRMWLPTCCPDGARNMEYVDQSVLWEN